MEHFAQGIVAGFAVSMTIPAMYYFNKAVLGTLFVVNREIGKALVRVIQPNETRNDDDDDCCSCGHDPPRSCYNCKKTLSIPHHV